MDPVTAITNVVSQGLEFGGLFVERGNIQRSKLPTYINPQTAKQQQEMLVLGGLILIVIILLVVILKKS